MKKFLKLCATFTLVGALFVGCIDNKEPSGVEDIRHAIADIIRAKARVQDAKVEVEKAKAVWILAKAEYTKAEAEHEKAIAALKQQEVEASKIKNEYERGILEAKIAKEQARLERKMQEELTRLQEERKKTAQAEYAYLKELITLEEALRTQKITALNDVCGKLMDLILEKAVVENDILEWKARKYFYENVTAPYIKADLEHSIEYAQLNYDYRKYMYELWDTVKNLAIKDYPTYAADMAKKMEENKLKTVALKEQVEAEKFELAKLEAEEDAAEEAYRYGGVQTFAIPNVFSQTADDIFQTISGSSSSPGYVTGVKNNTYSFYAAPQNEPINAKVSLGYKNTLDQLISDSLFIVRNRVINGVEGWGKSDATLKARKDSMDNIKARYDKYTKLWRENYAIVKGPGYWTAEKTVYTNALKAFNQLYGAASYTVATTKGTVDSLLLAVPGLDVAGITDPNMRRYVLQTAYPSLRTVNGVYNIQKYVIEQYVTLIKTLIDGDNTNDWGLAEEEISDILGGVNFTPSALFALVVGQGNASAFYRVVNTLLDAAMAADYVKVLKEVMPIYYSLTKNYQGATIYGDGPLMEKYGISQEWEYHAWFLIYILFESNPISIGNNIFRVGSYTNVAEKLPDDFLGSHSANYAGYSYANQVMTAKPTYANRITSNLLVSGSGSFPKAAGLQFPLAKAVVDAELALYNKWTAWGTALADLNTMDKRLYGNETVAAQNYNSNWVCTTVDGKTTYNTGTKSPSWVNDDASKVYAVRDAVTLKKPFYFMPDNSTSSYPSLVDGEDLYWANTVVAGVPGVQVQDYQWNFYPSIAAKRVALTGVNWNQWVNIGYPTYQGDPVLWTNDFTATWENNANLPNTLLSRAFVAIRNYNQFKFWYDENKEHDSYNKLLANLHIEIEKLRPIVQDLYDKWAAATEARIYKDYEIRAMEAEANLYDNAYAAMGAIYNRLYNNVISDAWNPYHTAFQEYQGAIKNLEAAKANLQMFIDLGIYTKKPTDADTADFINNRIKDINAEIAAKEKKLETINAEMAILEAEKIAILDRVVASK